MNTSDKRNRDLNKSISFAERNALGLIRLLLPPRVDNEQVAEYLRTRIGQGDNFIEWITVQPDDWVDENEVSEYELYALPIRSAIFNAGTTSRINVGHSMADLIANDELWNKWKGLMPVFYNKTSLK